MDSTQTTTCTRFEQPLMLLAHGELSGIERLRVQWHLNHCESCQDRWIGWRDQSRRQANAFRQAAVTPPVSTDFLATFAGRLAAEPQGHVTTNSQPHFRRHPATHRAFAMAAVVAAIALLLLAALAAPRLMGARMNAVPKSRAGTAATAQVAPSAKECTKPPPPVHTPSADEIIHGGH